MYSVFRYLLQYPLKPIMATMNDLNKVKLKPVHKKMEFELASDGGQLYNSSAIADNNSLCVGVMKEGNLHLSPLSSILQMRPSFTNMTPKGESLEDIDDTEPKPKAKETSDSSSQPQQVQMKRKESERAQHNRLNSYSHLKSLENAEAFQCLQVHQAGML